MHDLSLATEIQFDLEAVPQQTPRRTGDFHPRHRIEELRLTLRPSDGLGAIEARQLSDPDAPLLQPRQATAQLVGTIPEVRTQGEKCLGQLPGE